MKPGDVIDETVFWKRGYEKCNEKRMKKKRTKNEYLIEHSPIMRLSKAIETK